MIESQYPPIYWISTIASVILLTFLFLYLPIKKIKSKLRFLFIPLYLLVLLIAVLLNIIFLSHPLGYTENSLMSFGELATDYKQEITSKQKAIEVFQDYFSREEIMKNQSCRFYSTQPEKVYAYYFNSIPDNVEEMPGNMYSINFCDLYILTKDGRLYNQGPHPVS